MYQSLTMFAKIHKINRDELLEFLIAEGVVSDISTITEKGLKLGIKYKKGEKAGVWPVYGQETVNLIKNHKFIVPFDTPLKEVNKSLKDFEISSEDIIKTEYSISVADQFLAEFNDLLKLDKYIARSNYKYLIEKYKNDYNTFISLKNTDMLSAYIVKNNFNQKSILDFINKYGDISDLQKGSASVMKHNNAFINKHLIDDKEYLDHIFNDNVRLDDEQRRVVLSDEDYTLVVAGAGAGKSTTVAAKVKYLIEKGYAKPEEILVVSFTNDSVNDLKKKIEVKLKIKGCDICTFHKVGYKIIKDHSTDNFNVANDGTLYEVIDKYLKTEVLKEPTVLDNLILFFSYYLNVPFDETDTKKVFEYIANASYEPLKSYIEDNSESIIKNSKINSNNKINITINREVVGSIDEVEIANFLFLNSIDYEYEKSAPFNIPNSRKDLAPDFYLKQGDKTIWYEHFGLVNEDGTSTRSKSEIDRYKKAINDKFKCFKDHGIDLIYTYHNYKDGRSRLEHLKEILESKGFVLNKKSNEEVYQKIVDNAESQYISKLVKLIVRFIGNFKACGYNEDKFVEWINENRNSKKSESIRTLIFLEICSECYHEYQKQLKIRQEVDFQDMINDSRKILESLEKKSEGIKKDYGYKYIIVDEFQDISKQRFDFTATLSRVTNAKIVAVGDDWQSIYAFSGSDLDSFIEFSKRMGYGLELAITSTRRNSQELLDIAGKFIMQNDRQIKKPLVSNISVDKPVIIETYNADNIPQDSKGGKFFAYGLIVEKIIEDIIKHNEVEGKNKTSILLIGRYNFDGYNLSQRTGLFNYENRILSSNKYPNINLRFLTAHRSKGLEEDNVIIINAKDDMFGFPTKIDNDPILDLVINKDDSIEYAEERRLFYVALTRTKNRVYIAVPEDKPSRFIVELLNDKAYNNIQRVGNINFDGIEQENKNIRKCPHCGYPMQFQYNKKLDKKLWICKNEKELCGYMTNWYIDDKNESLKKFRMLSILRCDDPNCKDGYLIVRKNKNKDEFFLGCTNYHSEIKCQRQMSLNEYLKLYNNGEI